MKSFIQSSALKKRAALRVKLNPRIAQRCPRLYKIASDQALYGELVADSFKGQSKQAYLLPSGDHALYAYVAIVSKWKEAYREALADYWKAHGGRIASDPLKDKAYAAARADNALGGRPAGLVP